LSVIPALSVRNVSAAVALDTREVAALDLDGNLLTFLRRTRTQDDLATGRTHPHDGDKYRGPSRAGRAACGRPAPSSSIYVDQPGG
jgi:hypothetical protein